MTSNDGVLPDANRDLLEVPVIRGVVERVEDDPDRAFIDHLSERYLGQRPYPYHQPGDERVTVYIRPTDSSAMAA